MNLAPQTAESDNSTTLFRPISLPGLLHRRLNLHLGTVTAFVVVNLFLIAACLLVLRQNLSLRTQVAGDVALLTPRNGSLAPPLAGTDWTGTQQSIVYGHSSTHLLRNAPFASVIGGRCAHYNRWRRARFGLSTSIPSATNSIQNISPQTG